MSFEVKFKHGYIKYNSTPLDRMLDKELLLDDVTMIKIHTLLKSFYDRYTPKAENILAGTAKALAEYILYDTPYAHYIWEGRLMVDPDTLKAAFCDPEYGFWSRPGIKKTYDPKNRTLQYQAAEATAHWNDTAFQNHKDEIIEGITKILTMRAKEVLGQ